jgi:hypothetical protein
VAARDVAEVRDHEPDGEAVCESDRHDVRVADDSRAAADEDEREGADVLRDSATEEALVHELERYEPHRTVPMREDEVRRVRHLP